jgi:translation initiation factor IF-2
VEEVVEIATEPQDSGKKVLHLKPPIIVKNLAEQLDLKPFQLIKELMALSIFANLNQTIEPDVAAKICDMHGFVLERDRKDTSKGHH